MKPNPALLGLVVAKKKAPGDAGPPPFGGDDLSASSPMKPAAPKPKIDIKIGAEKPDDGMGDDQPDDGMKSHSDLDEIMGGDPKVAMAVKNLLTALCGEEKSEGGYSDAGGDSRTGMASSAEGM